MPGWESVLAAELSTHHHVTTRKRLQRLGVSRRVIDGLCRRERLEHIGSGVLVSPSGPQTFEQRLAIACALTGGVITFPTAGKVWELRKTPTLNVVHVNVTRAQASRPVPDWIVVHRSCDLPRCDIVYRRDGIAVTSPPRTTVDAAAWLEADDLESVIEQGIAREYFTVPTLWGHARRLCHRGRRGSTRFVDVLGTREPWRRAVDSDYELRLERAMRAAGFPLQTRQHPVEIAPGTIIHPDLGIPEDGFFVEVDHLSWHGARLEGAYDRRRDRKVRATTGYHVERVTDMDIDHDLQETIADLLTVWQRVRAGR
jgi:very-short-patch-repair endonuclease